MRIQKVINCSIDNFRKIFDFMKIYIHNMFCIYKKKIRRARKTAVENNIYNTREELYKLIAIWLNLCTWWMTEIYEFMWDTWASETIWGSLIKYRWRVRMCEIKTFFSKYFFLHRKKYEDVVDEEWKVFNKPIVTSAVA